MCDKTKHPWLNEQTSEQFLNYVEALTEKLKNDSSYKPTPTILMCIVQAERGFATLPEQYEQAVLNGAPPEAAYYAWAECEAVCNIRKEARLRNK